MTVTVSMQWFNADSTEQLNLPTKTTFAPGIVSDGLLVPVSGQLQVTVGLFTAVTADGCIATSDSGVVLNCPANQTTVLSLLVVYNIGGAPTVSIDAHEISAYQNLPDLDKRLVFGQVTVPNGATQVLSSYISYASRDSQDQLKRLNLRGTVPSVAQLPLTSPNLNKPGDFYMVTQGVGDTAAIYAWNGLSWDFITNSASIAATLAAHRANLYSNEIHLTDLQAQAVLGSYGSPNLANPFVTSTDPRVPTLGEAQALVGSDGTPSSSNLYITQAWALPEPTVISFPVPPGSSVPLTSPNGPFFVGKGASPTATKYFSLVDYTLPRGFVNPSGSAVQILGVFKDAFLTLPVVPLTDADSNGFYTGNIYLQLSAVITTPFRVVYGQRFTLGTIARDFPLDFNPGDEYIPSLVVQQLANIKGRTFDATVPTREQNINLRLALDGVQCYLGSVLDTNVVATLADYNRLVNEPTIGANFVQNVGITVTPTFVNSGLVGFSYNHLTGVVTYASAVNLTGVATGNLFQDGAGVQFIITAVGLQSLTIAVPSTGLAPAAGTVTTSVGTPVNGACYVNFNPRGLLLSEMKTTAGVEVIKVSALAPLSEYSQPDGLLGYGVQPYPGYVDPRVAFFGGWENYQGVPNKTVVRNVGSSGVIDITGFFTSVSLLVRKYAASPNLAVSVNRQASTVVSTSNGGSASSAVANSGFPQYSRVLLATGLSTTDPNNIQASIIADTANPLEIFGIELVRDDNPAAAVLESGVAFQNAQIVSRSTIDSVPVSSIGVGRGGRQVITLASNSYVVSNSLLATIPTVPSSGSGLVFTISADAMANYLVNDLVYLQDSPTAPTVIEIRRLTAVTSTSFTVDSASSVVNPYVIHLASTSTSFPFPTQEQELVRYNLISDLVSLGDLDFETPASGNRFVVAPDMLTVVSGTSLSVATTGLSGATQAVLVNSGGSLVISAPCTRIDIVTVNNSSAPSVSWTVDGSPSIIQTWTGGAATKQTLMANARYTSHEIVLSGGGGNLAISEIILWGPAAPSTTNITGFPVASGDLFQVSQYVPSQSALLSHPQVYPLGAVFFEASTHFSFVNGGGINTDWVLTTDYAKHIFGRYLNTSNDGAYIEFLFLGDAFELQYVVGPDHGIFTVTVDGSPLESAGGTIVGNYTSNQVDAYAASYDRSNIGSYGLPYGYHRLRAVVGSPRTKNPSSTGYAMSMVGCFVANNYGQMFYGFSRGGFFSGIVDDRDFFPIPQQALPQAGSGQDSSPTRANIVSVPFGTTQISVLFTNPLADANYVVNANFYNDVDAYPLFQPITISSKTASGFVAKWNSPLVTSNMYLHYSTSLIN